MSTLETAAREALEYLRGVCPLLDGGEMQGPGVHAQIGKLAAALDGETLGQPDPRRLVRAIFAALDVKLAAELKGDVLHAGSVLATLMMIRDTVAALDPELGELSFPQAHAAAGERGQS